MEEEKIGFYCSSTSWGGLEMNFIKSATWMSNRNYRIKVYCVKGSPIAHKIQASDLNIKFIRRNRKYYDFMNAYRIYKILKKDNIKAVWITDKRDMSTIGLAKTFSGNKFQFIYHQQMQIGVPKKHLLHTIRFSKIDAWITLLNNLATEIKNRTNFDSKKVHIIPLAVDIKQKEENRIKSQARKKFDLPSDKFMIGILGRISPQKGQLFLVEQLAKLRSQNLDVEVLIVGEATRNENDGYDELLRETVKKLNLSEYIHFHSFISDPEVFYTAIDLFIMASSGETFGSVTIEAMTCGVPVLGTNASGTPEILDHGNLGFLYEVNDGDDFCEKVKWILKNPKLVNIKMLLAQKTANEKYSQSVVSDQIEAVFSKLNLTSCKKP